MLQSHIILAVGWILFCVLHSIFASMWFKQIAARWMGGPYKFYRLYYTLFATVGFMAIMIYLFTMTSYKIFTNAPAINTAGAVITLFGLIIMTICVHKYFIRLSGLKILIETRSEQELMITGIHKHVRHPLYTGTFIFIWGLFLLYPYYSLLITNAIITIYTLLGLRFEEQKLEKDFGEKYTEYKKQVPMLIPRFSQMRTNKATKTSLMTNSH